MFDRDGLYLEISPRGGKWWRLKYRYAGKEKRRIPGRLPGSQIEEGPRAHHRGAELLDAGVDPSENRRAHESQLKQKARGIASRWLRASGSSSR